MNEKVKELLRKVSSDETLIEKLKKCKNESEVIDFAKGLGCNITKDDFNVDEEKLSNKELQMISGGACGDWLNNLYIQCGKIHYKECGTLAETYG